MEEHSKLLHNINLEKERRKKEEQLQLIQDLNLEKERLRNLNIKHSGWIEKQDRKRNHIFRGIKRWKKRYLTLTCYEKDQDRKGKYLVINIVIFMIIIIIEIIIISLILTVSSYII